MVRTTNPRCTPAEHSVHRRQFLGMLGAGAVAANFDLAPAFVPRRRPRRPRSKARTASSLYLGGGASQLETWDPKPGRPTGGPYDAIQTSVPGLYISELLPKLARADAPPGGRAVDQ